MFYWTFVNHNFHLVYGMSLFVPAFLCLHRAMSLGDEIHRTVHAYPRRSFSAILLTLAHMSRVDECFAIWKVPPLYCLLSLCSAAPSFTLYCCLFTTERAVSRCGAL